MDGTMMDFPLTLTPIFVDAIPHTSTGKVFKSELRERYKDWSAET